MSEEEIKRVLERKRDMDLEERVALGLSTTKDGQRIFASKSDDKGSRRVTTIPRTVADKINFSNILESLIKNIDFVSNYSYEAMARGVLVLLNHIPEQDMDDQFREDVTNATIKIRVPTGRYGGFGGGTYEIMEEYEEYDFLKIYRAIFNLLRRRGTYTLPRLWDERRVGVLWKREGKNKPVESIDDVEFKKQWKESGGRIKKRRDKK